MVNNIDLAWAKIPGLNNRYFNNRLLEEIIAKFPKAVAVKVIGYSEEKRPIYRLAIGNGEKNILAWSQMHGNETTNTRAILDLFNLLLNYKSELPKSDEQDRIEKFLADYTLYSIPILNPDGAEVYTRENANKMDLNRDAKNRTQNESRVLWEQVNALKPELCLNLHDQRSIFGLDTGKPATVSFLAPSADDSRAITPARAIAIKAIERANSILQQHIPDQIGRFDDSFNINCSGDYFTNSDYPTILIEAGHYGNDYARETTRNMLLLSYLAIFNVLNFSDSVHLQPYKTIPENRKNFADLVLLNVKHENTELSINLALYFKEILVKGQIMYLPEFLNEIKDNNKQFGHQFIDSQLHNVIIGVNNRLKFDKSLLTNINISDKFVLKSMEIVVKLE